MTIKTKGLKIKKSCNNMGEEDYIDEGKTLRGVSEYELQKGLGKGAMGTVYLAKPDLEKFDYAKVLAFRGKEADKARRETSKRRYLGLVQRRYDRLRQPSELPHARRAVEKVPGIYPSEGKCVIKTLDDPRFKLRFLGEWAGLMGLPNCQHVMVVYDGGEAKIVGSQGEERAVNFYAMQYLPNLQDPEEVAGRSLRDILKISEKASRGVSELHHNGIIHRDIKPDNILVTQEGIVKVSDTGIAKDVALELQDDQDATNILGSTSSLSLQKRDVTMANSFLGTPTYASPEQARGEQLGIQSDMFSLGTTVNFWLTGKSPFEDIHDVYEILRARAGGIPSHDLRSLRPDLPEEVIKSVEKMTHAQVHKRYATMEEVADVFRDLSENYGEPHATNKNFPKVRRKPRTPRPAPRKPIPKKTLVKGLIGGLVGLVSAGLIGLVASNQSSGQPDYNPTTPRTHQTQSETQNTQPTTYATAREGSEDLAKFKLELDDCLEFTRFHRERLESMLQRIDKATNANELQRQRRRIEEQLSYIDKNVRAAYYFTEETDEKGVITDQSGNRIHGKAIGQFVLEKGRSDDSEDRAINFLGNSGSYIMLPDNPVFNQPPLKISIWTKPSSRMKLHDRLLSKKDQYDQYYIGRRIAQEVYLYTKEGVKKFFPKIIEEINMDRWNLIENTLGDNFSELGINSSTPRRRYFPVEFLTNRRQPLIIGNVAEGNAPWNGAIDSIEITDPIIKQ